MTKTKQPLQDIIKNRHLKLLSLILSLSSLFFNFYIYLISFIRRSNVSTAQSWLFKTPQHDTIPMKTNAVITLLSVAMKQSKDAVDYRRPYQWTTNQYRRCHRDSLENRAIRAVLAFQWLLGIRLSPGCQWLLWRQVDQWDQQDRSLLEVQSILLSQSRRWLQSNRFVLYEKYFTPLIIRGADSKGSGGGGTAYLMPWQIFQQI